MESLPASELDRNNSGFKLNRISFGFSIVFAVLLALWLFRVGLGAKGSDLGRQFGWFFGGIAAAFISSWIGWRLSAHSNALANFIYCAILVFASAGMQFKFYVIPLRSPLAATEEDKKALERVNSLREKARTSLSSGSTFSPDEKDVQSLLATMDSRSNSKDASPDEKAIMRAVATYVRWGAENRAEYQSRVEAFSRSGGVASLNFSSSAEIDERITLLQKAIEELSRLATKTRTAEEFMKKAMADEHLSSEKADLLLAAMRNDGKFDIPIKLTEEQHLYFSAVMGILELLKAQWGRWHWHSDTAIVEFNEPAASDLFAQLLSEAKESVQRQISLQQKVFNVGPTSP